MPYSKFRPEQLILRDHLAIDRTTLANERTFLAYLRTAILVLISAVTLLKVYPHQAEMLVLGLVLVPVGAATGVLGLVRFQQMRRKIAGAAGQAPREQEGAGESGEL